MKYRLTAAAFAGALSLASLAFTGASQAQGVDPKQEWAAKVVALQQGPELDRLVEQLAASTTQDLLQNWGPKVQALPAAGQEQVKDQLNAELKKYTDDVAGVISGKVAAASKDALVPAYAERFTLDELKQIAAFFESPAIKKYQSSAPELGNVFIQKLVESTRADVATRADKFNEAATKIIGSAPKAAPAGKSKPPAKP
jgi:hypothetical protein